MHRRQGLILAAFSLLLGVASGAPMVAVTAAPSSADPLCTKASQLWPDKVAQQDRRAVSTDSSTEAAWGKPAIIARCGVAMPPPNPNCIALDGVDWVMTDLADGKAFVTYGRQPAIQVLVPNAYYPEPLTLGAFTKAARQIPQGTHRCT